MGSFMTNSRTCLKHLCALLRGPPHVQSSYHSYCTRGPSGFHSTKQRDFTQRKRTSSPRQSVFAAGNAKRTAEMFTRKSGVNQGQGHGHGHGQVSTGSVSELPDQALSVPEWRDVKSRSSSPEDFELRMMKELMVTKADISIAKSLLNYVAAESGTLPYKLLHRYLTLCVFGGHHSEVSDVYDIMRNCFKTLDTGAYSLFVKGLSQTERWREVLVILEDIKKVIKPSSRNYGDAVAGAVLHGDRDTAWHLYGELMDQGLIPSQETWRCLFESDVSQRTHKDKLLSILTYMRENQIYPEEKLVRSIKAWFESLPDEVWRGTFTSVGPQGMCQSCGTELESIQLTEEEYTQLKHRVMEDVIEGRDVFNKTTPEELESFKSFVRNRPKFDVVIDGLNIGNTLPNSVKSATLLAVVSELQGLNILVLGRKHMQQPSRYWNRHDMNQIKQKAHCFFTENISEDDPFLLYATLHSGNHCNFLSRDLMRDHKACLPDNATRRLFFKWQRGHQLVIRKLIPGKMIQFERTSVYDTIVQSRGGTWHIPYDEDGGQRATYEVPQRWLCVSNDV